MQNERISFDAMPEMLAAIAQKLESIELSMDGRVLISFLFTRKGRVLHSASQRLTNGCNKATERVRLILCERPANLLTGRKTSNNLS